MVDSSLPVVVVSHMIFSSAYSGKYISRASGLPATVAQMDACPTGDQVAGSNPAGSGNILSWRLIMKYFL